MLRRDRLKNKSVPPLQPCTPERLPEAAGSDRCLLVGCRNMMEVNKNFQREKLSAQTLDSRNTGRYETLPD